MANRAGTRTTRLLLAWSVSVLVVGFVAIGAHPDTRTTVAASADATGAWRRADLTSVATLPSTSATSSSTSLPDPERSTTSLTTPGSSTTSLPVDTSTTVTTPGPIVSPVPTTLPPPTTISGQSTLTGTVRDLDGQPVSGPCISALPAQAVGPVYESLPAAADGTYQLTLASGDYYLVAEDCHGHTSADRQYAPTSVAPHRLTGAQTQDFVVHLLTPLFVNVFPATGVPRPTKVCIDPTSTCRYSSDDGPAYWDDLTPGTYVVHVNDDSGVPAFNVTVVRGLETYVCPYAPPWQPC
jgi:hypothetical protein